MISNRKKLFVAEGCKRTAAWKTEKKRVDDIIRQRKRSYMDTQRENLLGPDAARSFFKNVKNFAKFEKPEIFDVRSLFSEGNSDQETAESLAEYFSAFSLEFDPLSPDQIPHTHYSGLPRLKTFEVAGRVKRFKKPHSMVPGYIYPSLMTKFSDFVAIPLTEIYNEITRSYIWPKCWKKEFVTVIPKKSNPQSISDI